MMLENLIIWLGGFIQEEKFQTRMAGILTPSPYFKGLPAQTSHLKHVTFCDLGYPI